MFRDEHSWKSFHLHVRHSALSPNLRESFFDHNSGLQKGGINAGVVILEPSKATFRKMQELRTELGTGAAGVWVPGFGDRRNFENQAAAQKAQAPCRSRTSLPYGLQSSGGSLLFSPVYLHISSALV